MEQTAAIVAVVDDEFPIRKALTRLLRSAHYEVESYASGPEFLKSLAQLARLVERMGVLPSR